MIWLYLYGIYDNILGILEIIITCSIGSIIISSGIYLPMYNDSYSTSIVNLIKRVIRTSFYALLLSSVIRVALPTKEVFTGLLLYSPTVNILENIKDSDRLKKITNILDKSLNKIDKLVSENPKASK